MKEEFLHHVWKFKNFRFLDLKTSKGEPVILFSTGAHNPNEGPDFLNARIKIADQLWAGNVEIHVKSSDWYLHGHEKDNNYANVILHVVWEDDVAVFRKDNTAIPALVLKEVVSETTLHNYQHLFHSTKTFINCEKQIYAVDDFSVKNWLERLYFERLEEKSEIVMQELQATKNDWEAVLFRLLMKNFGLYVNGASFYSIATAAGYAMVRKIRNNVLLLEALFFGLAGFLDDASEDHYTNNLREAYTFLKQKFGISGTGIIKPKFAALRPANFPTIRLAQLAMLYHTHQNLFSGIMAATTLKAYNTIFAVKTSPYWTTHYTFGKSTLKRAKKLTPAFVQLLVINTVLPLRFCYAKHRGEDHNEDIIRLIKALKPENNTIIEKYKTMQVNVPSAMESQALLQLYRKYCTKHKCLQCAVGNRLISGALSR